MEKHELHLIGTLTSRACIIEGLKSNGLISEISTVRFYDPTFLPTAIENGRCKVDAAQL
jgi:hypothetical protein